MATDSVNEEWRAWRNGDYEVSSLGRVRRARPGRRTWAGRLLTPTLMKIGYLKVSPVIDGKNVLIPIHVLVAECFLGPCPEGHEVNHIDGNKANPVVTNLEYVTHAENMRHAVRAGLQKIGADHGGAKLTEDDVREIRAMRLAGASLPTICERFGIGRPTASQIANRKTWRHVA
jgi:hypothetical protein